VELSTLEELIGYCFVDKDLLRTAMTHSSAVNEQKAASNQRLEFLGDAVLQLSISNHVYPLLQEENEGVLSNSDL
jgi:ribonuclease-3